MTQIQYSKIIKRSNSKNLTVLQENYLLYKICVIDNCLLYFGKSNQFHKTIDNDSFVYRLVLLNKLLEDGNVLYRKSRLEEAAHRYDYRSIQVVFH